MGGALQEQLQPPRLVRVGLIQHSIDRPTNDPIKEQRDALHNKIANYIDYAALCGVNIICLQEAWSTLFFYFRLNNQEPMISYEYIYSDAICILYEGKISLV